MNNTDQEFKCVLCDAPFPTKEELQVHFRKHADPNFKQKKGREQNESEESVEKTKGQIEMVECDVCPEMFTSISKAITHKHKVHPDHDTKYFCAWCGKLFTMKHLYNKHLKSVHSNTELNKDDKCFHCDSCEVTFIHSAMVYHNKFYHRQEELPSIGHSKKLKMVTQETVQIYYCPFCGEEFDNKVNLHKHMSDDHSDENQRPEEVLRCPLCDAIFYHLDAYEIHLTYHSSEDLYAERNQLIEETTDFSLETVQPQREKIENAVDSQTENGPTTIGIEELLEFTMDDNTSGKRKSKKQKKHKKSKKAAITLDEFLNMNKDVFGEGIDFQGIEEVPTQSITKRLKTKKLSTKAASDIAKLKKQGIIIKKKINVGKPITVNKVMPNQVIKTLKKITPPSQVPMSKLSSTDDVLSKLLNQGSQIKIIKKSNQDEEQSQHEENNKAKQSTIEKRNSTDNPQTDNICTKPDESKSEAIEKCSEDNEAANNEPVKATHVTPPVSPTNNETDLNTLENHDVIPNNTTKINDSADGSHHNEKPMTFVDGLNSLKNNSNIEIKKSNQNLSNTEVEKSETSDNGRVDNQLNEPDAQDDEQLDKTSEKPCLDAIRHLSHLITIKPVQKSSMKEESTLENGSQSENTSAQIKNNSPKITNVKNPSYVKNLGEITIKPSINSQKQPQSVDTVKYPDPETEHGTDDEWNEDDVNMHDINNVAKIAHILKNPQLNVQTKPPPKTKDKESPKINTNNDNSKSSSDLVKHLKNITVNSVNQKIQTPKSSPSSLKTAPVPKTSVQKEISKEGIEIYSIDDSDSDEGNCKKDINPSNNAINNKIETQPIDVLKNINKNITIKSNKVEQVKEPFKGKCNDAGDDSDGDEFNESIPCKTTNILNSPKHQNVGAVHNVLKFLGKNITVKSRNSSPSQCVQSQDHNSREPHLETNDAHSDTDPRSPRVKITEIENPSDDEFTEDHEDNDMSQKDTNVKIQHPDDSHSDHDEFMDDEFEDMADFESQITSTTLHKPNDSSKSKNVQSNQLQNISKELTVKPSQNKHINAKSENSLGSEDIPEFAKNLSNQISIKQIKKPESKATTQAVQKTTPISNQSLINQRVASSSNQVNTSNKEVKTVKTYRTQTETVIEEITTTVTKTIKTVNQTMKQEVRNVAQSSSKALLQKVQGFNTNVPQKNFQGIKVRQSAPIPINMRPKIRGTPPQVMRPAICAPSQPIRPGTCAPPQPPQPPQPMRPATGAPPQVTRLAICGPRASNQPVPVRPSPTRPSGPRPRLSNAVNVRASTSGQQRPQVRNTVKISPGAVISPSPKRAADSPGHFSCFKKPKESLIPVPDFSDLKSDGESVHSSAVHMSKSNFSSTTKTVKGNSVVTSTKMKSEMSASSQQLSRLQGMSGLSVVKTSQAKQTHVEEHTEVSASKRNTLEAIQKLQNQGLLVKKPRLDANEDSDNSEPHSDDMGHDSNEEFDDYE